MSISVISRLTGKIKHGEKSTRATHVDGLLYESYNPGIFQCCPLEVIRLFSDN